MHTNQKNTIKQYRADKEKLQTELSEMKKEREELIKKLSSTRVKDKNGVEIFDGDRVKERLIDFEKDGGSITLFVGANGVTAYLFMISIAPHWTPRKRIILKW